MTDKHRQSAGERTVRKFNRKKASQAKEIAALKDMAPDSIMKKMGVVRLFKDSRTYNKIMAKLKDRNARLQALGVRIIKRAS